MGTSRKICVQIFIMIERCPFFNETKGLPSKVGGGIVPFARMRRIGR
jgi:hypothetical protein